MTESAAEQRSVKVVRRADVKLFCFSTARSVMGVWQDRRMPAHHPFDRAWDRSRNSVRQRVDRLRSK
ncbi:hypothetical protein, partial [Nocardioides sp.]|uniref:hypothetical protein n=1 Tax=Nocardioides sp. TaxID=35761 RepID=UPI002732A901